MADGFNVAVVGATGLVGRKMLQILEERDFPVRTMHPLASARSAGQVLTWRGKPLVVRELRPESFREIDVAFFSAGATVSGEFAPIAAKAGALVIDNSSGFRMDDSVPLVVPEVNPDAIFRHRGIIANPNCSTIQMVVVLKPLHDRWKIRRVIVSTYQSVTGAGKHGVSQLESELAGKEPAHHKFPHRIAMNALPQVDVFVEGGYTKEEMKMVNETRKIMEDPSIMVSATCVRIPVIGGHSESVNIEFELPFEESEVTGLLGRSPGVIVQDAVGRSEYPMAIEAHGRDEVFVGRIRRDSTIANGLNLWIVSDNLRKGAATNAVQIAEVWAGRQSGGKVSSK